MVLPGEVAAFGNPRVMVVIIHAATHFDVQLRQHALEHLRVALGRHELEVKYDCSRVLALMPSRDHRVSIRSLLKPSSPSSIRKSNSAQALRVGIAIG